MSGLARKASLLLALSLLASAAMAYAECAWVLWWNSAGTWEPIRAWHHGAHNSAASATPWTRAGRRGNERDLVPIRGPEEDHPRGQQGHNDHDSADPDHAL